MRSNINTEHLEGRVYEHDLTLKKSGPQSKNPGTEYIAGTLRIATDEEGVNVVDQHFTYVTENTKSGGKSQTFVALKKIIEEGKTWITDGKDEAIKVKCDTALALNDFYTGEGEAEQLVTVKRNEGGFVNIVSEITEQLNERATWAADMVITNITHVEANEERKTPEMTSVRGAIFNFKNDLLPMDFVVVNPEGMNFFENLEVSGKEPLYTKVWGQIESTVVKQPIVEESAFGAASVRTVERKVKQWVITGTAKVPYDFGDEKVMTVDELTKASQDRETYLADIKKRNEEWKAQQMQQQAQSTNMSTAMNAPAKAGGFNF